MDKENKIKKNNSSLNIDVDYENDNNQTELKTFDQEDVS